MTISSGGLPGSIIILLAIDYLPRATWMGWMLVALAAIFAVDGGTLFITFETNMYALTVTLYVLAQVMFNLDPDTITFMLPAELFATKYRGTFYGLAAASGGLGAITILLITDFVFYSDQSVPYGHELAAMLLAFSPAMLLGALVTCVWIPEVKYPRGHDDQPERSDNTSDNEEIETTTFRQKLKLPNRPLADIARNPGEGQILGMRRNIARLFRAIRTRGTEQGRPGKPTHGEFQMVDTFDQRGGVYQGGGQGLGMGEADVGDALGIMQVRYN
ncbi:hypothetical protein M434DRAFT_396364 [Hypoxylon sp. CO27-5]|nr:hypothetical protein M434DRAFT_396364 [Hypoxylon sp. CO27-5]